ncbi:MAG: DUF2812 domain-containing protein [Eubacterium sp.]|nr:DUF2812 domain-containing protein [Eubacterium sp.]
MISTKTELKFFSVPEWEKEQDYLSRMHKKGWKFTQLNFCFYHFEQCEPEDVVYQLDYNPDGISHKSEYVQMFSDCGWEYLQDFAGYSYFRKPACEMNGSEEIFCDDESRLEMMKRVFRWKILPLVLLFFGTIIPSIFGNYIANPIIKGSFLILFVIYVVLFTQFGYKFFKYKNSTNKK